MEFALLFPLFVLAVMGICAFGIYIGASHGVQQLTADAARTAVSGLDAPERKDLATRYVTRNADAYAFLDPQRLQVTAGESPNDPAQFVISIAYDARDLPIWTLLSGLPLPAVVIEHRSTIRTGGS